MSEKQEKINNIIGLMHNLMLSAETRDLQPWLHLEMTREQMRIILLISLKGPVSPGVMAELLGVPKANVTSVVERLVSKGLVSRQGNPNDRRSHMLSLTEEGKSQINQLFEISATRIKRVLERMPDAALAYLNIGLESLAIALKKEGSK